MILRRAISMIRILSTRRHHLSPVTRLQISNVTRQTVLATSAELADNATLRNKGLLGRSGLGPGEGMWIVPGEAIHTFGMQFPIDLAYLDRNRKIRKVRSHVLPWRVSACLTAHSVLELPSGTICGTRTQVGDELSISSVPPE
jgi:uncharacterized membrane protein (UPF0127 family)